MNANTQNMPSSVGSNSSNSGSVFTVGSYFLVNNPPMSTNANANVISGAPTVNTSLTSCTSSSGASSTSSSSSSSSSTSSTNSNTDEDSVATSNSHATKTNENEPTFRHKHHHLHHHRRHEQAQSMENMPFQDDTNLLHDT